MKNGCIAVLGMFDGVHIGHQTLLHRGVEIKAETSLPILLLTFQTHPKALFGQPPLMLTDNRQKEKLCMSYGVDEVLFLPFDNKMRTMLPEQFVKEYLIEKINARYVIAGENYRFGYCHAGSAKTLSAFAEFQTEIIPSVCLDGETVSSSRIRSLLEEGKLDKALKCLGHPLEIEGRIESGRQVGRSLGFPTANMSGHFPPLRHGVYFTKVLIEKEWIPAISNFGVLPTFSLKNEPKLESHLLHFQGDLYRKQACVQFLKFVREERKFETSEELTNQVKLDIKKAEQYFKFVTIL